MRPHSTLQVDVIYFPDFLLKRDCALSWSDSQKSVPVSKNSTYIAHRLASAAAGTPNRKDCAMLRKYAGKTNIRTLGSSFRRAATLCLRAEITAAGTFGALVARLRFN